MTSDLVVLWLALVLILWAFVVLVDRAIDRYKQRHFDREHDHYRTERAEYYDPDFNWPERKWAEEER